MVEETLRYRIHTNIRSSIQGNAPGRESFGSCQSYHVSICPIEKGISILGDINEGKTEDEIRTAFDGLPVNIRPVGRVRVIDDDLLQTFVSGLQVICQLPHPEIIGNMNGKQEEMSYEVNEPGGLIFVRMDSLVGTL